MPVWRAAWCEQSHVERRCGDQLLDASSVPEVWDVRFQGVVLEVQVAVTEQNVQRFSRVMEDEDREAQQGWQRVPYGDAWVSLRNMQR